MGLSKESARIGLVTRFKPAGLLMRRTVAADLGREQEAVEVVYLALVLCNIM